MRITRGKAGDECYEHAVEFEVGEVFEADTPDGVVKVRCVEDPTGRTCENCALYKKAMYDDCDSLFCKYTCACVPCWRHDGRYVTFVEEV